MLVNVRKEQQCRPADDNVTHSQEPRTLKLGGSRVEPTTFRAARESGAKFLKRRLSYERKCTGVHVQAGCGGQEHLQWGCLNTQVFAVSKVSCSLCPGLYLMLTKGIVSAGESSWVAIPEAGREQLDLLLLRKIALELRGKRICTLEAEYE